MINHIEKLINMKKSALFFGIMMNAFIFAAQLPQKKVIAYVQVRNGVMQPNTIFIASTNISRTHRLEQESNYYKSSNACYELKPFAPKKKSILVMNKIEKLPPAIEKILTDALDKAKGEAQNYPKSTTLWHYYEDKSLKLVSEKKLETTPKNNQKSAASENYDDENDEDIDYSQYYDGLE